MPPPPAELTDDLVGEFLLRIPPDDPACLLRASLVCKRWRRILADPAFRRCHRALHRTPAVLGFISNVREKTPFISRFVPIDPGSRRPAARIFRDWLVLDCRHGRALFLAKSNEGSWDHGFLHLVVWDTLTNEQHRLPRLSSTPPRGGIQFNAAVLCAAAAEGCDHSDCHGGPFSVVFIFSTWMKSEPVTLARVYSSESGDWVPLGDSTAAVCHPEANVERFPCPTSLVGNALYFRGYRGYAFEYHLGVQRLSVIDGPPKMSMCKGFSIFLMSMEDGRLGFANVERKPCLRLCLWSRETSPDGVEQWTRGRAVELETLLPDGALPPLLLASDRKPVAKVVGFAEGTDVIFVGTNDGAVYMVQLNSGRVKKVSDACYYIFPCTSFCISVMDATSTDKVPVKGVSSG